jgi:hypothetical protein
MSCPYSAILHSKCILLTSKDGITAQNLAQITHGIPPIGFHVPSFSNHVGFCSSNLSYLYVSGHSSMHLLFISLCFRPFQHASTLHISMFQAIPACIYSLFAGPWSDRHGRKILIIWFQCYKTFFVRDLRIFVVS